MALSEISGSEEVEPSLRLYSAIATHQRWRGGLISAKHKLTVKELGQADAETSARAAESILLLPLNWGSADTEPVYSVSTESVAKLFAQQNIPSATFSPITSQTHLKDERAMDWVAPTLFVSGLMWSQNPMAVNLALNVIASYATDLFKGIRTDPQVKLTVVRARQRGKTSKEIHYEGPASGLASLVDVLSRVESED